MQVGPALIYDDLIGARIDFRAELARLHLHLGVAIERLDHAGHARADRCGRRGTDDAPRGHSADLRTAFELHLHELIHERHVVVQMRHDPERTGEEQQNDQHAEGKRHDIVDVVRTGRDVEEEDEVNAHLRDCENDQGDRNAWPPDECGARDEEGHNGEQRREPKSNQIALNSLGDLCAVEALIARRGVRVMEVACRLEVAHCAAPIKYTTVNIATQMMSRACQNRLKQSMRRRMSAR